MRHYRGRYNILPETVMNVKDGDVLEDISFVQPEKETMIFVDVKNLSFINCNLKNCIIPVTAKHRECYLGQHDMIDGESVFQYKREHTELTIKETENLLLPYKEERMKQGRPQFIKKVRNGI